MVKCSTDTPGKNVVGVFANGWWQCLARAFVFFLAGGDDVLGVCLCVCVFLV